MADDFYSLLGVPRTASEVEIKSAYRKLAMRLHPDRNPGDKKAEEKFRKINGAYEALSDAKKRQLYDQYGEAGLSAGGAGGGGGGFPGGVDVGDVFGDIFESFFGGEGGGRRRSRRGADLKMEHQVSLEDAYRGAEAELRFERIQSCGPCEGSGARRGTGTKRCPQCRGSGQVQFSQGFFSMRQACGQCGGAGQIIENPCPECRGAGRVRRPADLKVKIPPGIYDGATLRITGEGEAGGPGAAPGDLFVAIRVKADPRFERHEDDLVVEESVGVVHAALGTTLEVPTIEGGRTRIKIPPGVQHGATFRLQGKGMPKLHGRGHGDLLVKVRLSVPQRLTDRERELFEELKNLSEGEAEPKKEGEGIFKKIFGP